MSNPQDDLNPSNRKNSRQNWRKVLQLLASLICGTTASSHSRANPPQPEANSAKIPAIIDPRDLEIPKVFAYDSYRDVRGDAARPVSIAMGIDEPSGIANTGYLVEIREAPDHIRLSAHAASYAREVKIYRDRHLEVIDLDRVAKECRKTIYRQDGTITSFVAPWSYEANGYMGSFKFVSQETGKLGQVNAEWEKFDTALMEAETKANQQPFLSPKKAATK